jgi:hypothetical protein
MYNQSLHKYSDSKEKTRNIGGMHRGLPCSQPMLAHTQIGACGPPNLSNLLIFISDSNSMRTQSSICKINRNYGDVNMMNSKWIFN